MWGTFPNLRIRKNKKNRIVKSRKKKKNRSPLARVSSGAPFLQMGIFFSHPEDDREKNRSQLASVPSGTLFFP